MTIPANATRKDLRRIIAKQAEEISELRRDAEIAQEVGVAEGIFYPDEAVLPWQDYDETVKRLEALRED